MNGLAQLQNELNTARNEFLKYQEDPRTTKDRIDGLHNVDSLLGALHEDIFNPASGKRYHTAPIVGQYLLFRLSVLAEMLVQEQRFLNRKKSTIRDLIDTIRLKAWVHQQAATDEVVKLRLSKIGHPQDAKVSEQEMLAWYFEDAGRDTNDKRSLSMWQPHGRTAYLNYLYQQAALERAKCEAELFPVVSTVLRNIPFGSHFTSAMNGPGWPQLRTGVASTPAADGVPTPHKGVVASLMSMDFFGRALHIDGSLDWKPGDVLTPPTVNVDGKGELDHDGWVTDGRHMGRFSLKVVTCDVRATASVATKRDDDRSGHLLVGSATLAARNLPIAVFDQYNPEGSIQVGDSRLNGTISWESPVVLPAPRPSMPMLSYLVEVSAQYGEWAMERLSGEFRTNTKYPKLHALDKAFPVRLGEPFRVAHFRYAGKFDYSMLVYLDCDESGRLRVQAYYGEDRKASETFARREGASQVAAVGQDETGWTDNFPAFSDENRRDLYRIRARVVGPATYRVQVSAQYGEWAMERLSGEFRTNTKYPKLHALDKTFPVRLGEPFRVAHFRYAGKFDYSMLVYLDCDESGRLRVQAYYGEDRKASETFARREGASQVAAVGQDETGWTDNFPAFSDENRRDLYRIRARVVGPATSV